MKFNKDTIEAAVERMTKDPFWRDLYENAPDGAKRRLRVAFWGNVHLREREDLDAYRAERERIEGEMTLEDTPFRAPSLTGESSQAIISCLKLCPLPRFS